MNSCIGKAECTHWQSILSVIPPCPGIECPKSLMLNARLKPEAKKPPNGATSEANVAITKLWIWKGAYWIVGAARPSWSSVEINQISFTWRTYGRLEEMSNRRGQWQFTPYKDGVGFAGNVRERVSTKITRRTDHVVESHEEGSPLYYQRSV
jgi:hypothetical protein